MLIARQSELTEHVAMNQSSLATIGDGFIALAEGKARLPDILGLELDHLNAAADVKAAYIEGLSGFAVKLSTRFYDNPRHGRPSASGLMVVVDAATGEPRCLLLDEGYLTSLRTALAGALAARHLAPERVDAVTVFGAGSQARWQIQALQLVRQFRQVFVVARDSDKAAACAHDLGRLTGVEADPAPAKQAVARSQVVVTTTPSRLPLLKADMIHPELHITAMGSDAPHKQEIDAAAAAAADRFICDARHQCLARGELRAAVQHGGFDPAGALELGDILVGKAAGRESRQEFTYCDLTGVGVQDTAIALHAERLMTQRGVGSTL